jgi:hypothetical protein
MATSPIYSLKVLVREYPSTFGIDFPLPVLTKNSIRVQFRAVTCNPHSACTQPLWSAKIACRARSNGYTSSN